MQLDENSHLHADLVGWHSNIHGFDNFKFVWFAQFTWWTKGGQVCTL